VDRGGWAIAQYFHQRTSQRHRAVNPVGGKNSDSGSAVVDFVLVSVLLVGIVLAALQVAFAIYVRNTMGAAAAEGARRAANADQSVDDGISRARVVMGETVGSRFAREVSGRTERIGGLTFVTIEIQTQLPVIGVIPGQLRARAVGHALVEKQP